MSREDQRRGGASQTQGWQVRGGQCPTAGGWWWCEDGGCVLEGLGVGCQAHAPRSPAECRAHNKPMATRGSPWLCLCPERWAWPPGVLSSILPPLPTKPVCPKESMPGSSVWDVSLAPLCHLSLCLHGSDTIYSVCAERVHLCLGCSLCVTLSSRFPPSLSPCPWLCSPSSPLFLHPILFS